MCFLKDKHQLTILGYGDDETIFRWVVQDSIYNIEVTRFNYHVRAQEIEISYGEFERRIRVISNDRF